MFFTRDVGKSSSECIVDLIGSDKINDVLGSYAGLEYNYPRAYLAEMLDELDALECAEFLGDIEEDVRAFIKPS